MKTILAIDPGSEKSAWVVTRGLEILSKDISNNEHMLKIVKLCEVDDVACEMIASYGMPVGKEVFETVRWIGRFEQAFLSRSLHPYQGFSLVYRKDVKMHLCNSMKAKDGNIRQALIDKVGPQGNKKNPGPTYGISKDIWSALAIAVTFVETRKGSQ